MIAAIYARKSTDQTGVADEQKSVTRQIDHARAYATRKGWTVVDEHIYIDDGISGAEFANRPGFIRLMNALKPRAPFQVLVMSEESRLGRESIETAYALKQLVTAGVRVFFYLEDRERTLDSPTDKIMMSLTAFADELEREKARQRTSDAMQRKARAGHVCGGRVFGYDNIEVRNADGTRSHVERVINEHEATIVRRVFELCVQGYGKVRIAKTLNDERAAAPRAQQGRPNGWAASSIREVLYRPLYRGELVYNRTKKRNPWGQHQQTPRPVQDWIHREAPALRIVSEALWTAAHARLEDAKTKYLRGTDGRLWGRPRGTDSKYLLPGFGRCACCNGVMHVRTRDHGRKRAAFYACTSYHKRGSTVCTNRLEVPMEQTDSLVLGKIRDQVLTTDIINEIIARTFAAAKAKNPQDDLERLRREQTTIGTEIARYVDAIGCGGDVPELVAALKTRRTRRTELTRMIAAFERQTDRMQGSGLLEEIEQRVSAWRDVMGRHTTQARQILRKMQVSIRFEPVEEDGRIGYRFHGTASIAGLFTGLPLLVTSPTGFEPVFWP
jgi:site-specific DNA recombinase